MSVCFESEFGISNFKYYCNYMFPPIDLFIWWYEDASKSEVISDGPVRIKIICRLKKPWRIDKSRYAEHLEAKKLSRHNIECRYDVCSSTLSNTYTVRVKLPFLSSLLVTVHGWTMKGKDGKVCFLEKRHCAAHLSTLYDLKHSVHYTGQLRFFIEKHLLGAWLAG